MKDLYVYMIGIKPSDWSIQDTKACRTYGIKAKGYYEIGNIEGMVLVGKLENLEDLMEMYFGLEIVENYLCTEDEFDYEDGRWITGSWFESKKSNKESLKEGISAFDKAIAKKYNGTESNGAGQYYLDWRFDLKDEMDNIEMLADKYNVKVEFQSDDGYFEVFEESKKLTKKSLKEEKVTDSLFSDVVFSMIKKFKLKKEYDVERPSWSVFNFRHKNKDAQFAITFDKRGYGDFLYGDVLAFGDEKDDIFKYKTDEVKIDSYNIEKECSNIIADCLVFIDTNKKITIFESKKSMKESKKSFEEFEDICYDNFSFAIDHTYEYKGDYFVVVYGDERQTEKFAKILRNNGFEATWYRLDDPHNECYLCYEIMAV